MLFGFHAAEPATCRLLDVGCADGAHLLPLAIEFPNAEFVGIDLSAGQVASGHRAIAALGLKNITLHCADFLNHDFGTAGFDYVIAHGFYSWVPRQIRTSLLRGMRKWLGASGVGYLSYNTYPGAHLKMAARQIGLELVEASDQGVGNVSKWRTLAGQLADAISSPHALSGALKKEFASLAAATDSSVAHDWFEAVNEPVSFLSFAEHLADEGLQFLTEAELAHSPLPHLTPAARKVLAEYGTSRLRREACLDVLTCTGFRQSLVVRAEADLPVREDRAAMRTLWLTSDARWEGAKDLREGVPLGFVNGAGTRIQLANFWVKSALCILADSFPQALGFQQLVDQACRGASDQTQAEQGAAVLQDALFELSLLGFVDMRAHAPRCSRTAGARPEANALARWQASQGKTLTNQHHVPVTIEERSVRIFITLLDGSRERAHLLESWRQACAGHGLPIPTAADMDLILARLARFALLVA
jgi:methyltransferase-like protein